VETSSEIPDWVLDLRVPGLKTIPGQVWLRPNAGDSGDSFVRWVDQRFASTTSRTFGVEAPLTVVIMYPTRSPAFSPRR
jgi:hypothetical protein